jgi:hypothetical protein
MKIQEMENLTLGRLYGFYKKGEIFTSSFVKILAGHVISGRLSRKYFCENGHACFS